MSGTEWVLISFEHPKERDTIPNLDDFQQYLADFTLDCIRCLNNFEVRRNLLATLQEQGFLIVDVIYTNY